MKKSGWFRPLVMLLVFVMVSGSALASSVHVDSGYFSNITTINSGEKQLSISINGTMLDETPDSGAIYVYPGAKYINSTFLVHNSNFVNITVIDQYNGAIINNTAFDDSDTPISAIEWNSENTIITGNQFILNRNITITNGDAGSAYSYGTPLAIVVKAKREDIEVYSEAEPFIAIVGGGSFTVANRTIVPVTPPELEEKLSNESGKEGDDIIFHVKVKGGSAPYIYQWYEVVGGTAKPIPGATSDTLKLKADLSMNGRRYYCVIMDAFDQKLQTNEATLTVLASDPDPIPKTGDRFPLIPLASLLICGAVILFILRKRKKG